LRLFGQLAVFDGNYLDFAVLGELKFDKILIKTSHITALTNNFYNSCSCG